MRDLINSVFARLGYTVRRAGRSNRFDAMSEVLHRLRDQGYKPDHVIDGGANLGHFAATARSAFPAAHIHLIEPQQECRAALERFARDDRNATLHPYALAASDDTRVALSGGGSTGAWIPLPGQTPDDDAASVDTKTLDSLFPSAITDASRSILLKLDLEGYEMEALSGAGRLIDSVDVAYIEVSFYAISDSARPVFDDIHRWFVSRGFLLFDFAALGDRMRDGRMRTADVVYVRATSPLAADNRFG